MWSVPSVNPHMRDGSGDKGEAWSVKLGLRDSTGSEGFEDCRNSSPPLRYGFGLSRCVYVSLRDSAGS